MKYIFETYDEYETLWLTAHDAILYWKKVRQMCQGKINMNVDGSETHFDEKYAIDQMVRAARTLRDIECSPHPEWNEEKKCYEIVTLEEPESIIITKTLKLAVC